MTFGPAPSLVPTLGADGRAVWSCDRELGEGYVAAETKHRQCDSTLCHSGECHSVPCFGASGSSDCGTQMRFGFELPLKNEYLAYSWLTSRVERESPPLPPAYPSVCQLSNPSTLASVLRGDASDLGLVS